MDTVKSLKVTLFIFLFSLVSPVYATIVVSELASLGLNPTAICALDFDKNGVPDTAVIGTVSKVVSYGTKPFREITLGDIVAIVAADLNKDGYLNEVVIVGKNVTAVDSNGEILWQLENVVGKSAAVVDLDQDNYLNEVVVGTWNKVLALDANGKTIWESPGELGAVNSVATTYKEIIVGSGKTIRAFNFDGGFRWAKTLPESIKSIAPIDFDATGKFDGVVVISYESEGDTPRIYARSYKEGVEGKLTFNTVFEGKAIKTVPADKYSKGKRDYVIFNAYSKIVWVTSSAVASTVDFRVSDRGFDIADFDGDGILDDVFIGKDATTTGFGSINATNAYGEALASSDTGGGKTIATLDLNSDNKMNDAIAVSAYDKKVYSILTTQITDTSTSTTPITTTPPPIITPTTQPTVTTTPPVTGMSVSIGSDRSIKVGEEVTLTPLATPSVSGGKIVSYIWTEGNKLLADTSTITLKLDKGTHNISVKVTDTTGVTATSSVVITVTDERGTAGGLDSDADGLTDEQEKILTTNPYNADTDGDGLIDSEDPNPLEARKSFGLPFKLPMPTRGGIFTFIQWGLLIGVGIFVAIFIREKILDILWEKRGGGEWGE